MGSFVTLFLDHAENDHLDEASRITAKAADFWLTWESPP